MDKGQKEFLKGLLGIVLLVCLIWKFQSVMSFVGTCFSVVSPLIYGCVIAFILNLIVKKLEKYMNGKMWKNQSVKRACSITLSIVILLGVISAVLAGLIPEIINSAKVLEEKLPPLVNQMILYIENTFHISGGLMNELQEFLFNKDLLNDLMKNDTFLAVVKTGGDMIGGIVIVLTRFTIGFFFAFYILMQKETLSDKMKRVINGYLPAKAAASTMNFLQRANAVYSGFITGQCVDAIILGFMVTLVMVVFQIPYPVLVGVIVAITALVPVIGAFIGCGIGMFLIAIESPIQSIIFLIIFLVLQQIDNKIVYPHVVGNAVGLPSIWIFAAIVVGGNISGVSGMFLGIPMAALVYTFLGEDLRRRERRKLEKEKEKEKQEEKS